MMSKKEIYAWTSLATSIALLSFFLIYAFGWPSGLEPYAPTINDWLWKILIIAVLIELVLELIQSLNTSDVLEDERDQKIEGKAYKNAYLAVCVGLIIILWQVLMSSFAYGDQSFGMMAGLNYYAFQMLVITLFGGSMIKAATQIFYYRNGV